MEAIHEYEVFSRGLNYLDTSTPRRDFLVSVVSLQVPVTGKVRWPINFSGFCVTQDLRRPDVS